MRQKVRTITLKVPQAEPPPDSYANNHLDLRLNHTQALALKRLVTALDQLDARLASSKHVGSSPDAIRWLLEQIGVSDA